jgi:outer membrane protein assembly factor BamD
MLLARNRIYIILGLAAILGQPASAGFRRKKYENPISKDTQQPDKVLFDKAVSDIEHGRYEVARLTLNTLINTYDTSEFMAKSKLAIADSWYREGGSHAWAQAEAEYKDFKLFYPTMPEAAESQEKVCLIHYKQMEKADRDRQQAMRAEDECRLLMQEYPNSKFAPQAQQMLRNIQEVLAEGEYKTGIFYHAKGSYPAAANRLQALVDQYPLFSQADESLWQVADSYTRMGDRFEDKAATAYTRIVKDYPLSDYADAAADRLKEMNRPVPEADPVAEARMRYEIENREKAKPISHVLGMFKHSPDTRAAAKSGSPSMAAVRPTLPLSVPAAFNASNASTAAGVTDVNAQVVTDSTALDTKPDARQNPPAATAPSAGTAPTGGATGGSAAPGSAPAADGSAARSDSAAAATQLPPPTNHTPPKSKKKPNKKKEAAPQAPAPATAAPQTTPASTSTATTDPQPPSK